MQALMLALMIAVLGYNAYGIFQVGPENASSMQWGATVLMLVFVLWRVVQITRR